MSTTSWTRDGLGLRVRYLGELSQVVQCSQGVELLQRQDQSLVRGWVHEVEVNEVVDSYKQNVLTYCTAGKYRPCQLPH